MKKYYVYILKCSDNSYYTGVTTDIEIRLSQHQSGHYPENYTYKRRPVQLLFLNEFDNIEQAHSLKKQIQGWSRKKKEAIISNNWEKLKELAVCRNHTHFSNKEKDKLQEGFDSAQPDKP